MSNFDTKDKNIFKRIIAENWERFKKHHPWFDNDHYNEVIQKALVCGSELGGYTEFRCMECGQGVRRVPFTCKSGFCLSCAKVYTDNVVTQISKMLRPGIKYRHVVLTIPEQLRKTFFKNSKDGKLLAEFMKTGQKCLEEVVSIVVKRKVKIGTIVVIQTHGRSGQYNPHLHIILTSGGICEEKKQWVEMGFLPFEIIHTAWKRYLLNMMIEQIPTKYMKWMKNKLFNQYPNGFVANVGEGETPQKAKGLAIYLAKYIASPPISVKRILKSENN